MFDSLDAIHTIYTDTSYIGAEENLIKDIKQMVNDSSVTGVWYCQRDKNVIALNLAKMATKFQHPQTWIGDDIPGHLLSIAPLE